MDWRQKLYFSFKINNIFTCSVDHFASNINAKDLNVAIVAKFFKSGGHTAFNCQTVFFQMQIAFDWQNWQSLSLNFAKPSKSGLRVLKEQ